MAIDFPNAPTVNQLFYASNGGTYQWNGTIWLPIGNTTATIYVGDTPPSSPIANQFWFNSALGQTFIYYNDGNTTQWVPANPAPAVPPRMSGDFMATFAGTWPGTAATVLFPTIANGNVGSYYNPANGRYTPPAGRYHIYAGVSGSTATGAATNSVNLRKNGTTVLSSTDSVAAANLWAQPSLKATVDANGTDYFDIQCAGTAWDRAGTTAWFGAFPISTV